MKNIDMIRGDTLNITFSIGADTVIDLSSDEVAFTFSVKEKATDVAYVFQKDKSAVTALGDNSFVFRIAPEDTVGLVPGYYYYDIQFDFGNDVYTLAIGQLHIEIDITRPPIVYPDFPYPDINSDGTVDVSDSILINQAYAHIQAGEDSGLTEAQEDLADCNRDGVIDSSDTARIMQFYSACQGGTYTNDQEGWTEFMRSRYIG